MSLHIARTLLKQAVLAVLCVSLLADEALSASKRHEQAQHRLDDGRLFQLILPAVLAKKKEGQKWGAPQLIETDAGDAMSPQVTIDATGNAVAVWYQFDGTRTNIWANRYEAGKGWDTAQLLETDNAGRAWYPQAGMDAAGNAVVVWAQSDGTHINILANRYEAGSGWGAPQLIETDNAGDAWGADVAVDAAGNAVAVWHQSDGTRDNIWANRYEPGKGWGTAQLLEAVNAGNARYPQVAVNAAGNAVAVWYQADGTRTNIWANRYEPGKGWGTAQLIETDNAGSAWDTQVAMDTAGNAVAVWQQWDGARTNIWANRCEASKSWGKAQLIETDTGNVMSPQVAMDRAGNAVAVWYQFNGTRYHIWSNRYEVGKAWGTAQLLETSNVGGDAFDPQVAMDAAGNALAVWNQPNGTGGLNIWANRYEAGKAWGTAQLIATDNVSAWSPQVAMNAAGNAVAVWEQQDSTGDYNIWAARFE